MLAPMLMLASIHIQSIAVPQPYHAVEIEVGDFPLNGDAAARVQVLLSSLVGAASTDAMTADTFLQSEYLKNGKDRFDPHIREWLPQSGLGVWPDRPAPELWKPTDIFRMARGQSVPLMNRVDRLTGGLKANQQALQIMLGSGMVMAIIHAGSTDDLLKRYKDVYLPGIKEPNLRIFPFYVPLLDVNSLRNRKAEDLARWLGAARLYLRESPPDHAVLIVSSADLSPILTRAGAKSEGDGRWSF